MSRLRIPAQPCPAGQSKKDRTESTGSSRQLLASRLLAPRQQCDTDQERYRGQGHGRSDGVESRYSCSHQKRDASRNEPSEGCREGEGAAAAFGPILLRKPKRVDGKVRSPHSQKEKADDEPAQRVSLEIEDVSETKAHTYKHQREVDCQCTAASESFRHRWQREASQNRADGQKHRRIGSSAGGFGRGEAFPRCKVRHR